MPSAVAWEYYRTAYPKAICSTLDLSGMCCLWTTTEVTYSEIARRWLADDPNKTECYKVGLTPTGVGFDPATTLELSPDEQVRRGVKPEEPKQLVLPEVLEHIGVPPDAPESSNTVDTYLVQ